MFVLNIADQDFKHVFHRQVADHFAICFFNQRKVRAALAEAFEQLRQRHMTRHALQRAGQLFKVEGLGQVIKVGQFQQQVFDVQQPEKGVGFSIVDRVTAEFVTTKHRQNFFQRRLGVQSHQVFTGVGPVDHFQLAHLDR